MAKNGEFLIPATAGGSFFARAREINPNAQKLNLRKILREGYPDRKDQVPEEYGIDYPEIVRQKPAIDASLGEGRLQAYLDKPVAIIGAGAAGLCAGYELMRCGLYPIFFESQTTSDGKARPGGRAYSHDFAVDGKNSAAELGCMRFPKSHTTLRAYVDLFSRGDDRDTPEKKYYAYKYAESIQGPWRPFLDPLLLKGDGGRPKDDWTVVYDTVLCANGVNNREPLRINAGTRFDALPTAIRDVSFAFYDLLFDESSGVLAQIVKAYADGDEMMIYELWNQINDLYQDRSIFEVLREQGWGDARPDGPDGASRLEIFGALGLGSGGFDAFWGTTFMEVLRIKLHEDETNQDAFVGGTSYMLHPFLTRVTKTANAKAGLQQLFHITSKRVITSHVVGISKESAGGVRIACEDGTSYVFPVAILTVAPTAISSSIDIDEGLFDPIVWKGIRRMPLTGSGKIFAAFDAPFWKGENHDGIVTTVTDYDVRQIYAFDDYHWASGSKAGVLMMSYTWGDWAHKMGSLSAEEQFDSALRMLRRIYPGGDWKNWDAKFSEARSKKRFRAINWTHERGFAGGYRMADLNRSLEQKYMAVAGIFPKDKDAALLLAGEAIAWLGLSGWVEGALHTGINAAQSTMLWFRAEAAKFNNWGNVVDPAKLFSKNSFAIPADPGDKPFVPPTSAQGSDCR